MHNTENVLPREININTRETKDSVRVCYKYSQKTYLRIREFLENNPLLNASMLTEVAVNVLMDELESENSRLVLVINK